MDREIDHLLNSVSESECVFVRNGKEHDGEAAADHLSLKRRRGAKYYSSADEFIEMIASKSSWSGKPYHIRCGSTERLAKDWFSEKLTRYREQDH